ncbi:MAG TPA: histidine phosphatase family protein [Acidimicrobiales bacterium]|nr:histidine phosphatase family protein [Acidimicrobiales bacterium]
MRILLVRHGQSVWNAAGRWQGWADPPLTELGRRQSRAAVANLEGIDVVVSSDLRRAVETAALLAEPLGLVPEGTDARLRERDVGEWTGLTRAEILRRWPGALDRQWDPPGGERATALRRRVVAVVEHLARAHRATTLAVTHGGAIRCLERHLGVEPEPLPNLGGVWVDVGDDGTMTAGPRVVLVDQADVAVTVPRQL